MEDQYFIENIIAVMIVLFGGTFLMIFKYVRTIDFDQVDKVIEKKKWWHSSGSLHLGRFFKVYKTYYQHKGINAILFINVIAYAIFLALVFKISTA